MLRLLFSFTLIFIMAACGNTEDTPPPTITPPPTLALSPTPTSGPTATLTEVPRATSTPNPRTSAARAEDQTYLRIVHGIPNFSPIDVYVDTLGVAFSLEFGNITQLTPIGSGEFVVRVMPAGARLGGDLPPYVEQTVNIGIGQILTFVISGAEPSLFVTSKDIRTPLQPRESRVELIHAIPDAPPVTIRAGGGDLILPVNYGEQAIPANVTSGANTFTINSGETVITTIVEPDLRERFSYTYVLIGSAAEPQVVQFADRIRGETSLRAINLMMDVLSVDVYLNGELFLSGIEYGRASQRQPIRADNYLVEIYPAGADSTTQTPLTAYDLSTIEEQILTLFIIGTSQQAFITRFEDDLSPVPPDQARMVFVNSLPNDTVTIEYDSGERIAGLEALPYRDYSTGILFDAQQPLSFNIRAGELFLEQSQNILLEAGRTYLYFVTGRTIDDPPIILSDSVPIDPALAVDPDEPIANNTPAPDPARVRVLNMLRDRAPIDVYLDQIPLALNLAHAQLTQEIIIPTGVQSLIIRVPGTQILEGEAGANDPNELNIVGYEFAPDTSYTIYAYGLTRDTVDLLILPQTSAVFNVSDSLLRLINLTDQGTSDFGLEVARLDQPIAQALPPSDDGTETAPLPQNRAPLYDGTTNLVSSLSNVSASAVQVIPGIPHHVFIIDRELDLLAKAEFEYPFQPGIQYDIIVSQSPTNNEVDLYIIPYDN